MKILVLADKESPYLWDYFEKSKFEGIDLIISCGDLAADYLSFLTTLTSIPVLYVCGIMMINTSRSHRRDVFALMIRYTYIKGFASLGLEVPCAIKRAAISIQKDRWQGESENSGFSS